jgi:hypothetical protein
VAFLPWPCFVGIFTLHLPYGVGMARVAQGTGRSFFLLFLHSGINLHEGAWCIFFSLNRTRQAFMTMKPTVTDYIFSLFWLYYK